MDEEKPKCETCGTEMELRVEIRADPGAPPIRTRKFRCPNCSPPPPPQE